MNRKSAYTITRFLTAGCVFFVLAAAPVSGQNLPRVGVAPLFNTSEDPTTDVLAITVARTIGINLELLGTYVVERIAEPFRDPTPAELDAYAARNRLDNIVYGSIDKPDARTTEFALALFDRREGSIIYSDTWTITSVFEVFDTADLVVDTMLDQFSDEPLALGQLAFANTGTAGDYRVYVNDTYAGNNLDRIRLLAGAHQVRVEQTRMFGRYVVADDRIIVPENDTGTLEFTIPDLTEAESERLSAFPVTVYTATRTNKKDVDARAIVEEYVAITRDLEAATYSEAITERQPEITRAFERFAAWFSDPITVEVEVEPRGPGREVASFRSRSVLFRYNRPIWDRIEFEPEEEEEEPEPFLGSGHLFGVYAGALVTRYWGDEFEDFRDFYEFDDDDLKISMEAGVSYTFLKRPRPEQRPRFFLGTRVALSYAMRRLEGNSDNPETGPGGERKTLEFEQNTLDVPVELLIGAGGPRFAGFLGVGLGASFPTGGPEWYFDGDRLDDPQDDDPISFFYRLSANSLIQLTPRLTGQITLSMQNEIQPGLYPDFEMIYESFGLSAGIAYHRR